MTIFFFKLCLNAIIWGSFSEKNRNFINFQKIAMSTNSGWLGRAVKFFSAKLLKKFHAKFQPNRKRHSKVMQLYFSSGRLVGLVGLVELIYTTECQFVVQISHCKVLIPLKNHGCSSKGSWDTDISVV